MAKWNEIGDTLCPIARATAIVGDRWTVPIIRELFVGSARFDEIQAQTGSTAQMLASRLKRLESEGMIDGVPTAVVRCGMSMCSPAWAGSFYPVIFALRAWGETWCKCKNETAGGPNDAPYVRGRGWPRRHVSEMP